MTTAQLTVTFAGPHVSVQDGGRFGMMRYGVPASGALDRLALRAANTALGNHADAPGIEVSIGGLSLQCEQGEVSFAVAGGGFIIDHAGRRFGSWSVATLRAGEGLRIRPGPWGSWCCLAFAGRMAVRDWLGSSATHALSGLGGGRVSTGASLTITDAEQRAVREGDFPCPVFARPGHRPHITFGPQDRFFSPAAQFDLLTGPWHMTDAWDRMGVRLRGPKIAPDAALDIPSEPVLRGSVQVAGDGVATVLLADHQTTGGYPKIATVLDCDLDAFVQLRPRDLVQFTAVTPHAAILIARRKARAVAQYLESLGRRAG